MASLNFVFRTDEGRGCEEESSYIFNNIGAKLYLVS